MIQPRNTPRETAMPRPDRLREAHAHIYAHGLAMRTLRLEAAASREDALAALAARAEAMRAAADARGQWLIAGGLRVEGWARPVWPAAADLDAACPDRPCVAWSFDSHALACNHAAMHAAGIDDRSPDPVNGRIVRDDRGTPTGLMLESAALQVWNALPEPGHAQRIACVRDALHDLRAHGFVEVHDMKAQPWLGPVLAELSDAGQLPARCWLYAPHDQIESFDEDADDWQRADVWLAGGKLFADGTLSSRTAWVLEPYADALPGMPRGQPMYTRDQIRDAIDRCRNLGLGLAVHAIGDGAVRAVLDAYETCHADTRLDVDAAGLPTLRIEHAELIDETDIPRFAELGVVASVQPCHLLTDIEALRRGLPHRLHRVLPLRELIAAGCTPGDLLWFGSDTPIVRPHPQDSLQAAVHRRRAEMPPDDALGWPQRLTEAECWRAFEPGEHRAAL